MEVRSVKVDDAREGDCPAMDVDRTIHRPFVGRFIATIRSAAGGEVVLPVATDINYYIPDALLPYDLTLAWWMLWSECRLRPGRYRVHTLWTIEPDTDGKHHVYAVSDPFTIVSREVKPVSPAPLPPP